MHAATEVGGLVEYVSALQGDLVSSAALQICIEPVVIVLRPDLKTVGNKFRINVVAALPGLDHAADGNGVEPRIVEHE